MSCQFILQLLLQNTFLPLGLTIYPMFYDSHPYFNLLLIHISYVSFYSDSETSWFRYLRYPKFLHFQYVLDLHRIRTWTLKRSIDPAFRVGSNRAYLFFYPYVDSKSVALSLLFLLNQVFCSFAQSNSLTASTKFSISCILSLCTLQADWTITYFF